MRLGHPIMRQAMATLCRQLHDPGGHNAVFRWSVAALHKPGFEALLVFHYTITAINELREPLTADQVVAQAQSEYEKLHSLPSADPDERERFYRENVQASPALRRLKLAMDEWCAIWFWPSDEQSLQSIPTPLSFHQPSEQAMKTIEQLATTLKFFHWELEFPDVFTPERSGFDAMNGNPPWDVMKPNSQEFFIEFDPLYRTYDKQAALRRQKELFQSTPVIANQWDEYNAGFKALANWVKNVAEPFDVVLAHGKDGESFSKLWAKHRSQITGYSDAEHPFRLQGSADLNLYKMFAEIFWRLLRRDGRLGVILPTGIYADLGTQTLREELLYRGRLVFLYAFQNEKRIFTAAFHKWKQAVIIAVRGGRTTCFRSRFRMGVGDSPMAHELADDILRRDERTMAFTPADVQANSPKSLSLVEFQNQRDLDVFRTIYANSTRIGDAVPGSEIAFATEFHSTNDSQHFPPLAQWEERGYRPDMFGRWIGPDGDIALPVYQGGMIHQFDPCSKSWQSGAGNKVVWKAMPCDNKRTTPQFLMSQQLYCTESRCADKRKIAYRRISPPANTRTFISSYLDAVPTTDSIFLLVPQRQEIRWSLQLLCVLNSMTFDFVVRRVLSGSNLSWFLVENCPVPESLFSVKQESVALSLLSHNAARLSWIHRRFAPDWLKLKSLNPEIEAMEWKHWWAVTEADRLRLRIEIDALCADLYGLEPDDFDWIVRDDKTDPKGFYRVDRQLSFRERLTGLAAVAFRALKEERWSAESAPGLSNGEFFDILGIPELTNAEAAKAKGLPGPLILNRDGCHIWKPEDFSPDDPRHGWTWEDCWEDAVALLGSGEAVEKYIAEKPEKESEDEDAPEQTGPKDLFGDPIPVKPKQRKMF